ncbi:MAG: hypothetical protein QW410_02330 [Nitrososphaerota archaeon]
MIDFILFVAALIAFRRFSGPLGAALLFAAFHAPGWFIASGNAAAAAFTVMLAVVELIIRRKTMTSERAVFTSRSGLILSFVRAGILLLMAFIIYSVGIGIPRGVVLAYGPRPQNVIESISTTIEVILSVPVVLIGFALWTIGSLCLFGYGSYVLSQGFKGIRDVQRYSGLSVALPRPTVVKVTEVQATTTQEAKVQEATSPPPPSAEPRPAVKTDARLPMEGAYDVIIDGSNIAYLGEEFPSLTRVAAVARRLAEMGLRWIVIVDASLRHKLPALQKMAADHVEVLTGLRLELPERQALAEALRSKRVYQVPARTDADRFILEYARRWNSVIVSNDTYSEYTVIYPDVKTRRVACMMIGEEVAFEPDPVELLRKLREGDTPRYIA